MPRRVAGQSLEGVTAKCCGRERGVQGREAAAGRSVTCAFANVSRVTGGDNAGLGSDPGLHCARGGSRFPSEPSPDSAREGGGRLPIPRHSGQLLGFAGRPSRSLAPEARCGAVLADSHLRDPPIARIGQWTTSFPRPNNLASRRTTRQPLLWRGGRGCGARRQIAFAGVGLMNSPG